jgi:hypothetical protein
MEVKKPALKGIQGATLTDTLRIGSMVRVKLVKRLSGRHVLVNFRGENHVARLNGSFNSSLFIARVQKLTPRLELAYIKDISQFNKELPFNFISKNLAEEKSFIHNLFSSDNFFRALCVSVRAGRKSVKASVQQSIARRALNKHMNRGNGMRDFLIMENMQNLFSADSLYFLLPLIFDQRRRMSELKVVGSRESQYRGVALNIHIDDKKRISFIIVMDYAFLNCTVSANDNEIEAELRNRIGLLESGLKSLKYDRKVKIQFSPYREHEFNQFGSVKKIDVMM